MYAPMQMVCAPELVDDTYILANRALSYRPQLLLHTMLAPDAAASIAASGGGGPAAGALPVLLDCGAAGILLQHREANMSVLSFLVRYDVVASVTTSFSTYNAWPGEAAACHSSSVSTVGYVPDLTRVLPPPWSGACAVPRSAPGCARAGGAPASCAGPTCTPDDEVSTEAGHGWHGWWLQP
jgi:hypothetical protein